jgi:putative oxidoreductase
MMPLITSLLRRLEASPHWLHAILCRWGVAAIFWRSGQTKVSGLTINESTFDLFRDEYKVPLLPPDLAAVMATVSEHVFPVLLMVGLASRLSAAALLGMTLVIQTFVYPGSWPDHLLWASALAYVLAKGPGALSIDHFILKSHRERRPS